MDIYKEERPWGSFTQFTKDKPSSVKILSVNAGESNSLQYHNNRDEFLYIISGNPTMIVEDKKTNAQQGDNFFIHKKEKHRIIANEQDVKILEISFGMFDEDDIVRLDDKYDRK